MIDKAVNGGRCVHMSYTQQGMMQCANQAVQSNSVNHGWLCEKHYWLTKTKPYCGRTLEELTAAKVVKP